LREVLAVGVASFIRQTAMSLLVIIFNRKLGILGGDIAIAVFGVVMRLLMFIFTPIMGIAQGLQPVAGFNYGAKRFDMMKKSVVLATMASTIIAISGTLLIILFPEVCLRLFSHDTELINQGRIALRYIIYCYSFPWS
ncbi:MAG: MATE family efflux transporter, partial [bacterium]